MAVIDVDPGVAPVVTAIQASIRADKDGDAHKSVTGGHCGHVQTGQAVPGAGFPNRLIVGARPAGEKSAPVLHREHPVVRSRRHGQPSPNAEVRTMALPPPLMDRPGAGRPRHDHQRQHQHARANAPSHLAHTHLRSPLFPDTPCDQPIPRSGRIRGGGGSIAPCPRIGFQTRNETRWVDQRSAFSRERQSRTDFSRRRQSRTVSGQLSDEPSQFFTTFSIQPWNSILKAANIRPVRTCEPFNLQTPERESHCRYWKRTSSFEPR